MHACAHMSVDMSVCDKMRRSSKFSFQNLTVCRRFPTYSDSRINGNNISTKFSSIPLSRYMLQSFNFTFSLTHHLFDFSECSSPESACTTHIKISRKNLEHKEEYSFGIYLNPLEEQARKWLHLLSLLQGGGKPKLFAHQHHLLVFPGLKQKFI